MIEIITKDLIEKMDKYNEMKKLKNEAFPPVKGPTDIKDPKQADRMMDIIKQRQAPHKEARFEIDVDEYWISIISAKIELVGKIGGHKLLSDVFAEIQKQDLNRQNRYSGIFNSAATGIEGWYA